MPKEERAEEPVNLNDVERPVEPDALTEEDREFDIALRPRTLGEFVGQDRVKEQLHLLIDGGESVERHRVLPHHHPGVQPGRRTDRRELGEHRGGDQDVVADAADADHHAIRTLLDDLTVQERDHRDPSRARLRIRAPTRWVSATATASAASA